MATARSVRRNRTRLLALPLAQRRGSGCAPAPQLDPVTVVWWVATLALRQGGHRREEKRRDETNTRARNGRGDTSCTHAWWGAGSHRWGSAAAGHVHATFLAKQLPTHVKASAPRPPRLLVCKDEVCQLPVLIAAVGQVAADSKGYLLLLQLLHRDLCVHWVCVWVWVQRQPPTSRARRRPPRCRAPAA